MEIFIYPKIDTLLSLKQRITDSIPAEAREVYQPEYLVVQFGHDSKRMYPAEDGESLAFVEEMCEEDPDMEVRVSLVCMWFCF